MEKINIEEFLTKPFQIFTKDWFLLSAGDFENNKYNSMVVSWGSFGTIWGKPMVQILVRPHRYTYEFMEKYDSFVLSTFDSSYKKDLGVFGSKSGKDIDKFVSTGLTAMASQEVKAPSVKEAIYNFECKKMYFQDMQPSQILDKDAHKFYQVEQDGKTYFHRIYFGEILNITKK